MPHLKGKVYSKATNEPLNNVAFTVSKFAINVMIDTIKTDRSGSFFYEGFFVSDYGDFRSLSSMIQETFVLKNGTTYRQIDVVKYYNNPDFYQKDTVDLGTIYFEDLKMIDRDSIPKR